MILGRAPLRRDVAEHRRFLVIRARTATPSSLSRCQLLYMKIE